MVSHLQAFFWLLGDFAGSGALGCHDMAPQGQALVAFLVVVGELPHVVRRLGKILIHGAMIAIILRRWRRDSTSPGTTQQPRCLREPLGLKIGDDLVPVQILNIVRHERQTRKLARQGFLRCAPQGRIAHVVRATRQPLENLIRQ